jgi:hypothetical protein
MAATLKMLNQRFGRLLVVEKTEKRSSNGNIYWNCLCDCGNYKLTTGTSLKRGHTKSCGCYFLEVAAEKGRQKKTHGLTESRTYTSWMGMKHRCLNPNNKKFKNYGARGIKVCDRWVNSFENFLADMGEVPAEMTLDRIDVNGNYEPSNCRWANQQTQQNNRRDNVIIKGLTMAEYCRQNKINYDNLQYRLTHGWPLEKALAV